MKKLISLILAFFIVFSFSACGRVENKENLSSNQTQSQQGQISVLSSEEKNSQDSSDLTSSNISNTTTSNQTSQVGISNMQTTSQNSTISSKQTTSKPTEKPQQTTGKVKNAIICFGDSITEGMGMTDSERYPSVLGKHLENQYRVFNAGVGGENSYTISARANALDCTVSKEMVFDVGVKELVSNYEIFSGMNGETMRFRYGFMGHQLSIQNLTIDGKPYTLRYKAGATEIEDQYILCRNDSSNKLVIPVGAKIKFDYSKFYESRYCVVVLMGANDSSAVSVDELIERYKKIFASADNFIAIIPFYDTDYTDKFEAAFGNNCVNLREYCKEAAYKDYKLTLTEQDRRDIASGEIPIRFTYQNRHGECHLNSLGYKILGDLVYKKGVELGYWK